MAVGSKLAKRLSSQFRLKADSRFPTDCLGMPPMPRSEERKSLPMKALLKITEGLQFVRRRYSVEISDISNRGCRIAAQGVLLAAGHRVLLKPENMESIS